MIIDSTSMKESKVPLEVTWEAPPKTVLWFSSESYVFSRWLFLRLMGAVYFCAFASWLIQIPVRGNLIESPAYIYVYQFD